MNLFFKTWFFVVLLWVIVLGGWIVGIQYSLHFKYWWFDVLMHFLGGVWALSLLLALKNRYAIEIVGKKKIFALFFLMVSAVVFVGVLWEFFEFVVDRYIMKTGFTRMRGVYEDTLSDLGMDVVGGAVGSIVYLLSKNKKNA